MFFYRKYFLFVFAIVVLAMSLSGCCLFAVQCNEITVLPGAEVASITQYQELGVTLTVTPPPDREQGGGFFWPFVGLGTLVSVAFIIYRYQNPDVGDKYV